MVRVARWQFAGYALVAAGALVMQSWWPLYFWIGPYLGMRWTYWLEGYGEHTGLTHEPCTLLNTRTLRTNRCLQWLNWNMNLHAVHHTFPGVPFFRLPALQREVERRLGFELPGEGYLALHWRHLRELWSGAGELDICAEQERRTAPMLERLRRMGV